MQKKLVIIVTVPVIIDTWLKGQAKYLSKYYDVTIVTSYSEDVPRLSKYEMVPIRVVNLKPAVTPFVDLKVIYDLYKYFKKNKIDIVCTYTPKAGLVGMISSYFAKVSLRIHNIVGLPLMESSGLRYLMFLCTEKLTYFCANRLYANSFGLKKYINEKLTNKKIQIIAHGSVNGVDLDYFNDDFSFEEKCSIRTSLGFKNNDFILLFIGRIVKDKGVEELVLAFKKLQNKYSNMKLLMVGDYQLKLDPITNDIVRYIETSKNIKRLEYQEDIRRYLSISDLFILPSYREGLPNVLIEAGAFGLPIIATDINGCNEVVVQNKNGLLIEPKSIDAIYSNVEKLYSDKYKLNCLRQNARKFIASRYNQKVFFCNLKKSIEGIDK